MTEITFSCLAYSKLMLHAAKYPHCSVNGLLLSKASAGKGKDIEFVDAVPLFHIAINLIPMAEIALTQVNFSNNFVLTSIINFWIIFVNCDCCRSNLFILILYLLLQIEREITKQGYIISGYYVAHENYKEASIDKSIHRISDKIAEYFPNACLVIVDNQNVNFTHMDNIALRVAQHSDGKYKPIDIQRVSLNQDETLEICSSLVEGRMFEHLYDFDNHLDDVSLDFMNNSLNQEITSCIRT